MEIYLRQLTYLLVILVVAFNVGGQDGVSVAEGGRLELNSNSGINLAVITLIIPARMFQLESILVDLLLADN